MRRVPFALATTAVATLGLGLALVAACGSSNGGAPSGDGGSRDASASEASDTGAGDRNAGDAHAGDVGPSSEAGDAGDPIVAPDNEWTWVDFPTAVCASGTPTGLAINPLAGADSVLIYFEGGGGCTDAATCWGPDPAATHLTGYDASTFASSARYYPALIRTTAGNPFAGMNLVYVPYCTGDLHSGTNLAHLPSDGGTIPTYFYGARDMDIFLERLVPTFPSQKRVWILGTSAGGFGSYLNFARVAKAFGVGVDIIDDSGPAIVVNGGSGNKGSFGVWGTIAGLPSGCSSCTSLECILDYDFSIQKTFTPPGEYGFLSFLEDTTISKDFGYSATTQYPMLMETFSASLASNPHAATFLVGNYESHVVESDPALTQVYLPWMTHMFNRSSAWVDETYDGGM